MLKNIINRLKLIFFSPMNIVNDQKRVYSEVVWQWNEELNRMVETSSVFDEYSGSWAYCANETDTDVATGGLGTTIAAAIVQFKKAAVAPPTIMMVQASPGTHIVNFPEYTAVAVTDVTNNPAGSDAVSETNHPITTTPNALEILRHSIAASVSDLANYGNDDALLVNAGKLLGNTVATEFDNHLCNLLDNLDTTVGVSTSSMSFATLMDGVGTNEANEAQRPYSAILHPLQVFGAFGLSSEIGALATEQSGGAFSGRNVVGDEIARAGFVSRMGGVDIYTSPQVVASGGDQHKGGLFAKTAFGCGYINMGGGSFIQLKTDRIEREASTLLVANGYWVIAELVGTHGVVVHTETS